MLYTIRDFFFGFFDGIIACFTANLSWQYLCTTFWFLVFIEFPRYYGVDLLVGLDKMLFWRRHQKRDAKARLQLFLERPLVSIIAPGKNEGGNIYKLVESLREQTYNNFEIIIVDDGSDDATPQICKDLERAGYIDKFFRMVERGGKASAANYAVSHCHGKYIVHLDADSSLDRDAIEKILLPFYFDRRIKAVGGVVKVRNVNDTFCTAMQAYEYLKTVQIGRMGTNLLGIYHIISGAFGAFETATLRQVGCWDIGPGLDGDLTQKFRKAGHKVWFAGNAICLTSVPTRWSALFKQRRRWSRSLVRFRIRKHSDIFQSNRNFSFSNAISNMEGIAYDFVFNYVWVFYIISLIFANTDRLFEIMVVAWIIRVSFSLLSFLVAIFVSERGREECKLFPYLFVHTFYSGYFMRIVRLIAHTREILFFESYKDQWNPAKTSDVARMEGI